MIGTWVSILPPIVAIVMVLATKRVLLSLGSGIVDGCIIGCKFFTGRYFAKSVDSCNRLFLG